VSVCSWKLDKNQRSSLLRKTKKHTHTGFLFYAVFVAVSLQTHNHIHSAIIARKKFNSTILKLQIILLLCVLSRADIVFKWYMLDSVFSLKALLNVNDQGNNFVNDFIDYIILVLYHTCRVYFHILSCCLS
jgi:hypothetical protein